MSFLRTTDQVRVTLPSIEFKQFENLMLDAEAIAERLATVEVTQETVKESKRMLAEVSRGLKTLNDRRIQIKKEILKPYDEFAEQIKEIETVVKTADTRVRDQVRGLEEAERQAKHDELESIWNARISMYKLAKIFEFGDWLENSHLNKSTSIAKSESDMVDFLEQAERDIALLDTMDGSDDLIYEYKYKRDVSMAIEAVREKERLKEQQKEIMKVKPEAVRYHSFRVKGDKDAAFVELLLKENGIEFERK